MQIIENPVKESEGLRQHELTMLLMIIENQLTNEKCAEIPFRRIFHFLQIPKPLPQPHQRLFQSHNLCLSVSLFLAFFFYDITFGVLYKAFVG